MTSSKHAIICGGCKSPLKTVTEPKPSDQVTCTGCGRHDRFDKIVATAQQHAAYLMEKALSESLSKSAGRNSLIQLTMKKPAHRSFRWMIEGGL